RRKTKAQIDYRYNVWQQRLFGSVGIPNADALVACGGKPAATWAVFDLKNAPAVIAQRQPRNIELVEVIFPFPVAKLLRRIEQSALGRSAVVQPQRIRRIGEERLIEPPARDSHGLLGIDSSRFAVICNRAESGRGDRRCDRGDHEESPNQGQSG